MGRRIFVAGHRGMVGSALCRRLERLPDAELLVAGRDEVDLTDQAAVRRFFTQTKIDEVYLAAAHVGGIAANDALPATFITDNLLIQTNVISAAHEADVQKLLFLGSSCIYPKFAPQPMAEEFLLTGPLEPTNKPYAIAKIAGITMADSFNRQYGRDYRSVMPTNLYGPGDNFHPEHSHVLPALLRRLHQAAMDGDDTVEIWGSGRVRREFLHVDDLADAVVHLMEIDQQRFDAATSRTASHVNIGTGEDCTIGDLARMIARVTGFQGELIFDFSKPDGTPRKLLDVSRLAALGWSARIGLEEGITSTYEWFRSTAGDFRGN